MRFWLALTAVLALAAAALVGWAYWSLSRPQLTQAYELRVKPGATLSQALRSVPQLHLAPIDKLALRRWAGQNTLRPGLYTLPAQSSLRQILQRLAGPSEYLHVTIVEGDNMYEIARKLQAHGIADADAFLAACRDPQLIEQLIGVAADRCEGYLWPETYSFAPYSRAQDIVRSMIELFWRSTAHTFASASFSRQQPQTIYRIVTLASVVEKETGAAHERPLIASVFLNRLIRGMRLQSDPTTIYGIWERFDGNLRKSDLLESTSYNTYKINGLPPTPIASPGLAAIQAALNPAPSNFLYFVAKGSAGVHEFTETYDEHRAAIRQYQLR